MTEPRPAKNPAKPPPTSVRRPVGAKPKANDASPPWYAPMFVTLMLIGLLWIVVFYLSQGRFPVGSLGNWNLGVGACFLIGGFLMTTNWR
ncbi:MAG: cell division protein CrgA [Austwickia sp.]|nr:cell division protein CrgA [Actinomycetota bacterium]MCO5309561.1 cell division protein CrgA [Austwickia sp.]